MRLQKPYDEPESKMAKEKSSAKWMGLAWVRGLGFRDLGSGVELVSAGVVARRCPWFGV